MSNIINFVPFKKGNDQKRSDLELDLLGAAQSQAEIIIFSGIRIERIEPEERDEYERVDQFDLPPTERLIK